MAATQPREPKPPEAEYPPYHFLIRHLTPIAQEVEAADTQAGHLILIRITAAAAARMAEMEPQDHADQGAEKVQADPAERKAAAMADQVGSKTVIRRQAMEAAQRFMDRAAGEADMGRRKKAATHLR